MNRLDFVVRIILSLPKTIFFNLRTFPLKIAIMLPVYIDLNVKVKKTYKGAVKIEKTKIKPFIIKIGIGGSIAVQSKKGIFFVNKEKNASIIFNGSAKFGDGIVLFNNTGNTIFGNNFSCNKNCFISCDSNISFGEDVLLGWNINIRDSDGHKIMYSEKKERDSNIIIGNHVWICSFVDILKGTTIGNNCVVGYRSLVSNFKCSNNSLIVGVPASVIKDNLSWEK